MLLKIADIKIKKRIRKDSGDLAGLVASLRDHGLMNPVVVNGSHELIAGYRRLEAARRLGWEHIEATAMQAADELPMLELEIEENVLRRDFTSQELAQALQQLEKLRHPGFFRRLWLRIRGFWRQFFP